MSRGEPRRQVLLNAAVVLSAAFGISATGYAIADAERTPPFTQLSLLTERPDGTLAAAGYPTDLVRGEPVTYHVAVGNREGRRADYEVVVALQRDRTGGDRAVTVSEVARYRVGLPAGERDVRAVTVTPTVAGDRLRIAAFLYRGSAPSTPGEDTAYRTVSLRVEVSE